MEIKVKSTLGLLTLVSDYNPSLGKEFYTVFDTNQNKRGVLYNVPVFDDMMDVDDEDLKIIITAINKEITTGKIK